MSTENLTTGEGPDPRIEAILAELKGMASSSGGHPRYMSEFDLAEVFADRFAGLFMAQAGGVGRWFFRPAPGIDEPREAYREVRHACVRMISLLTSASEADVDDKARLQRWGAVLNVMEIASWDPRLACGAGHSEDRPPESAFDLPLHEMPLSPRGGAPVDPEPDP